MTMDGAYIQLLFSVKTGEASPAKAFDIVRKISTEIEEAAQKAADDVGKRIAEIAARLSGWGFKPLDKLVEKVETATSIDDKGRSLEELISRLLEKIPGFNVIGRIRTATEEIDISVINDCLEPRLRRESALILIECKNWAQMRERRVCDFFGRSLRIGTVEAHWVFWFHGTDSLPL